jgi:hypothetical protein
MQLHAEEAVKAHIANFKKSFLQAKTNKNAPLSLF